MQSGDYVYEHFGALTPTGGPAPQVKPAISIAVDDGSFRNLNPNQPQDGVLAPGPAPGFPTTALASEANGTSLPSSAAPAPQTAVIAAPAPTAAVSTSG